MLRNKTHGEGGIRTPYLLFVKFSYKGSYALLMRVGPLNPGIVGKSQRSFAASIPANLFYLCLAKFLRAH